MARLAVSPVSRTSLARYGRSEVPSIWLEISPSRISRDPSVYRREASWRTYPRLTSVRISRCTVGRGRPDAVASSDRPKAPPASASISSSSNARSIDCTPPAPALVVPGCIS